MEWAARPSRYALAWRDLADGLRKRWLWTALAMLDIKLRYRGSVLGPFWLTVSTMVMIGAMGILYARLFHTDVATYLPFLAIGLVFWQFVSTVINEGCQTYLIVQNIIQQVRMPFSVHAYRLVCRNLIVLAHTLVIVPIIFVIYPQPIGWDIILSLPALAVLAVNAVWISVLFGMLSARFRDVPPIVTSFVQVVFFVTPIFWMPSLLGPWQKLAELNPLFAAIDIVRAPLLGMSPAPYSWAVMGVMTVVGGLGTFVLFARFRSRIAFWV
jgi:ABC-2 type transport system permease protein/lipopolysaccharide transport system permease protein